jgi:transposase
MNRRRKYRAVSVKNVDLKSVEQLAEGRLTIGLDIAKAEVLAVVRDKTGEFLRPWKAKQITEIAVLVDLFKAIAVERPVVFGMESTGTYGDCLRQAMTDAGLEVHRVSGKAKSDYEEIFDGVPSAHDGKDAAIIAELVATGKSQVWLHQPDSELYSQASIEVAWLDSQQDIYQIWLGRLEALLARHWPEATTVLKLSSVTLLKVLAHYGGPSKVAGDVAAVRRLQRWGGPYLQEEKIREFCLSAKMTVGVRMTDAEQRQMQLYAEQALAAYREVQRSQSKLKKLCGESELLTALADVVGHGTACVLFVALGDPNQYHCAEAYRKAMGLNLKERSSGRHQGKLKITKRGSSLARRWLYFAALRMTQKPGVAKWYAAKKEKEKNRGGCGVVAIMRKLALAIWHVAVHGVTFDTRRLFPGKPLTPGR